ncbi:MAG: hypothetical protein FWF95_04685, partial [Syntrophorhabdaceae bacterium]|nr:hypothetical protein [Syntrophorhabdaceae bacterium]
MLHLIDTRQGTANQYRYSNGNTLPYTGHPFGMNHFVVQTGGDRGGWFFHPEDRNFEGIRLTHQPSPWMGDFQHFLLTPVCGEMNMLYPSTFHTSSSYRPEEAVFQPHYLKVKQLRYGIVSELTPSTYGAKLRISYPSASENALYLRALNGVQDVTVSAGGTEISGYISNFSGCKDPDFKMWFAFKFNGKVVSHEIFEEAQALQLKFDSVKTLEVSLATSFIGKAQAALNLARDAAVAFDE